MNHPQLMKLTSIGLVSILLLGILGQSQISRNELFSWLVQKQRGDSERTFADWCHEKASLSPETKHTVEVLLKKAGTTECKAAARKLSSLTKLKLDKNKIRDIKPLASLTHLDWLSLDNNQISDIKPLASLTHLDWLSLDNNQISDIKP
ncbi:leucine-rich repeat domain-containing protein, partial [Microcoleus sp. Pol11C1]